LIQNCLYGVSSQPAAIHVANLELFKDNKSFSIPKTNLVAAKVLKKLPESQHMVLNRHLKHGLPSINLETISYMFTPLTKAFEDEIISTGFDMVICHLPYVCNKEFTENEKMKLI